MISTALDGLCMAVADSVPGVSGGTVAFILGFYDRFITSLRDLFGGKGDERKAALKYLLKLGVGWVIGMGVCVVLLSSLFEKNIYFMSSLFMGLTVSSVPFIVAAERKSLNRPLVGVWFALLGAAVVIGLTVLRSHVDGVGGVDYMQLKPLQYGWLFISGAVAITAMVLPGISGSSVLLIAGVYLPTVQAVRALLQLRIAVLPGLCALGLGVVAGVLLSIRAISSALKKHRGQMVWLILGLMIGSLYAIANGPASLSTPLPPLGLKEFSIPAFILGAAVLIALEALKRTRKAVPREAVQ